MSSLRIKSDASIGNLTCHKDAGSGMCYLTATITVQHHILEVMIDAKIIVDGEDEPIDVGDFSYATSGTTVTRIHQWTKTPVECGVTHTAKVVVILQKTFEKESLPMTSNQCPA